MQGIHGVGNKTKSYTVAKTHEEKMKSKRECYLCLKIFSNVFKMKRHIRLVHEKERNFKCKQCNSTFGENSELKNHIKSIHEFEFNHSCNICEKRFKTNHGLNEHVRRMHDDSSRSFGCEFCNKKFKDKRYLGQHVRKLHEGKIVKHICHICEKVFHANTSQLKTHIFVAHEKTKPQPHKCDFCDKTFLHKISLKRHTSSNHHGHGGKVEKLKCGICEKMYRDEKTLNLHKSTVHEGKKSEYACDKCDKKFVSKQYVLQHINAIHEKNRNFICIICSQRFSDDQNLKRHEGSVHDGQKIPCSKCDSEFTTKTMLKDHVRVIHEKLIRYKCEVCETPFKYQENLGRHIKDFHLLPT